MNVFAWLSLAALLLAALLSARDVSSQDLPPGPSTVVSNRFQAPSVPGPIELVHSVVDFAPGAGVASHTHGGQAFITVLEGAITLRGDDGERTYSTGATLIEPVGEFFSAVNETAAPTRLLASYVLPRGAPLTSVRERAAVPALGPTMAAQGRFNIAEPPAQFEVVQVLLDFAPGAWTPAHSHGGPVLVTVLEGQVTERREGVERRFGPGEGWTEREGDLHAAGNDGAAKARVLATFLLRRGAELTAAQAPPVSPAPAPARAAAAPPAQVPAQLPRTGETSIPLAPSVLIAVVLLGVGGLLRRPRG
jgi:quercetin dioxygenase-like cupin family protein